MPERWKTAVEKQKQRRQPEDKLEKNAILSMTSTLNILPPCPKHTHTHPLKADGKKKRYGTLSYAPKCTVNEGNWKWANESFWTHKTFATEEEFR